MRVVHQLIAYFQAHGALSAKQLDSLRANGFLPEYLDDEALLAQQSDHQANLNGGRFEGSGGQSPGDDLPGQTESVSNKTTKPLGIELLCERIGQMSKHWNAHLDSFNKIASHIGSTTCWQDSLYLLRHCENNQLEDAICSSFDAQDISLASVSVSLDLQDYRNLIRDLPRRTRARGAYRALMRTYDFSDLGKYAWVLKYPEVNDVFNLIRVKRDILNAIHHLFGKNGEWFVSYFRRHADTNLFWTFVILRSAMADDPWIEARRKNSSNVDYLAKLWPPQVVLQRAALYAVFMAPSEVLSFLTSDFDVPEDARGNPPWIIPSDWTTSSEKHYIRFSYE